MKSHNNETYTHNSVALQVEAATDSSAEKENYVCVDFNRILNEAYIKTGGNVLAPVNYMYINGLNKTFSATVYSSPGDDESSF